MDPCTFQSTMTHLTFPPFQDNHGEQSKIENQVLTSDQYSTNPYSIKARLRRMSLTGAKKVEEAGKTADSKALHYARKVLEAEPVYLAASDAARESMMKQRMRDTMEKRRMKGQDTRSKLAAFHAQDPRALRAGSIGSAPCAAFAQFLEGEEWTGARATRNTMKLDIATPSASNTQTVYLNTHPDASAGGEDMVFLNGVDGTATGDPVTQPSLNPFLGSLGGVVKPMNRQDPFPNLTPEPPQSKELDPADEVVTLRSQLANLRNTGDNILNDHESPQGRVLQDLGAHPGAEKNQLAELGGRLIHLETVVRAMQNALVPSMKDQMAIMEARLDELEKKVGDGCEAEVAKMREVFGSMRQAMASMGGVV